MRIPTKNIIILISCFLVLAQCRDSYTSPYPSPATGYLVVEGFIAGNGTTRFNLSRTKPLSGDTSTAKETGAALQVEGDDNSSYHLSALGDGSYSADALPLSAAAKYRLRIHTADNKEYLSDYTGYKATPPIDSINWLPVGDNLEIYINTHDPSGAARYYQWDWEETWEYLSPEISVYKYVAPPGVMEQRTPDEQIFTCWGDRRTPSILLATTERLSGDIISRQLIDKLPGAGIELSHQYSIAVKQYALTEDAFKYLTLMKKNSESLGSIFDAQPSQPKGNIHCLSQPSEQVIGFVSAGAMQQQRIFIERRQLPDTWRYTFTCADKDRLVPMDSLPFFFLRGYTPIDDHYDMNGSLAGFYGNVTSCVDCRARGGSNVKPAFWPN